ncbi:PTS galactitol transporter subunit IIC [Streptococcus sp. zg-86]|uniref:PTS galactitol transporter subunit IIC n=1 Tax=Streptococcus zhangguiae TaxID=2664091 RepID=A0A6I4RFU7_9STRE|nr:MULTISPECIES: PTS transporter subunit IIC [unclassified Streptococcus]MTB64747.1 PTS galactitol transporter subunit IIC [Streptococcus sp. zg-86]MTB91319.1 PTS galactitol transporter subunit IIC [Streptococcus sp. zg-36]MWV56750.1 PTS galactitol transporter subunit IIC [Streptococcus sp. zg-70]QTH48482.1 PTS galactitol transporter subunit IIC [Streptococcus sp. zg-86]
MQFFNFLLNAGPTVMLPVIITIIGLIFGLKPAKAFKSGLTLAIGFVGIKLVINFMSTNLGPAAKEMVQHLGVKLDALDVGWGSIAAVTWSSPIIAILIFAIFAVNMLMLILKATKTLDVDIWNYHHMAIVGVMVYFVTNNIFLGVAASVTMAITTFKIADWSAPLVERFFGIPGVTLPTVSALSSLVIAWPLNWLLDRIPGMNKIRFSVREAQKYLGFFGDQMILGLLMGFVIGLLARYDITKSFELGVNMAAVLILIPKMTSLFMEGLMPISEAAKNFTQKYFKGRELFIGLDAAVVVGNPDVITTALILIPLTIFMSVILPGNRVLPFADLAVIPFRVAMVVALTRGNLFKNLIIGLITTASLLYFGTITAPVLTEVAQTVGIDLAIAGGAIMISSFASTSMVQSFLVFMAFTGNLMVTMPIMILVIAASWYYFDVVQPKLRKVTTENAGTTDSTNKM